MFRVVKLFTDLQDSDHLYEVGDEYPRLGLNPSLARIKELSGSDNRQGTPLIEEIEDIVEEPKKKAPKKRAPKNKE
jgi:hypothetical protein